MAITNTRTVQRIEVYPANGNNNPSIMVVYEHLFDDTEDAELPVSTTKVVHLNATQRAHNGDDTFTDSPTDVSGQDPLVQSVCAAIWTYEETPIEEETPVEEETPPTD